MTGPAPEPRSALRDLADGFVVTLGRRLLALVLGIAWASLLARALGPALAGAVTLGIFVSLFGAALATLGFPWSSAFLIARGRGDDREAIGATLLVCAILGPLAAALGWGVHRIAVSAGWLDPASVVALGVIGIPLVLTLQILGGVLQGRRAFAAHALVSLGPLAVTLAAGLALAALGRASGVALMLSWLAGQAVTMLATGVALARAARRPSVGTFRAYVRESLAYGWKLHIGELAYTIRTRADAFLIGALASTAAVGIYSSAVRVIERLGIVSHAAMFVTFPLIANLEGDEETRRAITPRVARWNFLLTALAAILIAALARPLVSLLFGAAFASSVTPLLVLLPGAVAVAVSRVLTGDIAGRGRSDVAMRLNLIAMGLNVVSNLALIPPLGITGAALAASVTNVVNLVLRVAAYRRLSGVPVRVLLVPDPTDRDLVRVAFARARERLGRRRPSPSRR